MERLPDQIDSNARVEIQVDGVAVGTRRAVNFLGATPGSDSGTNEVVSLTVGAATAMGVNVMDYGATGDGTTDDSVAIQAALDDAGRGVTVLIPPGTYKFATTLQLNETQIVIGSNVMGLADSGPGTVLNFTGGATDHAFTMKSSGLSGLHLEGFRLVDGRAVKTSGDGLHLSNVKNGMILRDLFIRYGVGAGVGYGIWLSECEVIHITDVWATNCGLAGVFITNCDNSCLLENVKGDATSGGSSTMADLVVLDNMFAGQCNPVLNSIALESDTGCNVVRVTSTFTSSLSGQGWAMRGATHNAGGDVFLIESATGSYTVGGIGSGLFGGGDPASANLVNDTAAGRIWGADQRSLPFFSYQKNSAQADPYLGPQSRLVRATAATVTLDSSWWGCLVSTGGSDKTVHLPVPSTVPNREYFIKKVDVGAGHVIIDPGNGAGTFDLIQAPTERATFDSGSNLGTTVISPATTVTAGTVAVLLGVSAANKTLTGVTDSVGNTWTVRATGSDGVSALSCASCQVATQITSGNTITATWSSSTSAGCQIWVQECSVMKASSEFDVSHFASGSGTVAASGATATLGQAYELVFGLFRSSGVQATGFGLPSTGYTRATGSYELGGHSALEYQIVNATTAQNPGWTFQTTGNWAALAVAFKGLSTAQPEAVEGATTLTLTDQYDAATVISDGATWWVVP